MSLQDNDNVQLVLIEGLSGIGKSLLLQDIVCLQMGWRKFKIVLLVQLCIVQLQQVKFVVDLFQLVLKRETDGKEVATACSKYFNNIGKDVYFFDLSSHTEVVPNVLVYQQLNHLSVDYLGIHHSHHHLVHMHQWDSGNKQPSELKY